MTADIIPFPDNRPPERIDQRAELERLGLMPPALEPEIELERQALDHRYRHLLEPVEVAPCTNVEANEP